MQQVAVIWQKKTFNETVLFCDGTLLACLAHQVEHMISLVSLWLQYIKVYFVKLMAGQSPLSVDSASLWTWASFLCTEK